jgi:hypothetical protein
LPDSQNIAIPSFILFPESQNKELNSELVSGFPQREEQLLQEHRIEVLLLTTVTSRSTSAMYTLPPIALGVKILFIPGGNRTVTLIPFTTVASTSPENANILKLVKEML